MREARTAARGAAVIGGVASIMLVLSLVAAACSGSGDEPAADEPVADEAASTAGSPTPAPSATQGEGPVRGPIEFFFFQGLVTIDPATQEVADIALVTAEDFVPVGSIGAIGDGGAFFVTGRLRDGAEYVNDVHLTRVDLTTGSTERVAVLGPDREVDEISSSFDLGQVLYAAGDVWVSVGGFGDEPAELRRFDPAEGEEVATIALDRRNEFATDGDRLYAVEQGGVWAVDPATNEFGPVLAEFPDLGAVVGPAEVGELIVATGDGEPVSAENRADLLDWSIDPAAGVEVGDGALWWTFSSNISFLDVDGAQQDVLTEGIVRYDLATGEVTDLWPLGEFGGVYLEENTVDPFRAELEYRDGILWLARNRDNGPLLRFDPATGALTGTYLEPDPGVDFNRITFDTTAPEGFWIQVTRWVVTSESDDGSRTSAGQTYLDRIDPDTGDTTASINLAELQEL